MSETEPRIPSLSVSELNHQVKNLLESHFDYIRVEGEIGDFTAASSGHWYFTLKDAEAQVRCAMFRNANARVKARPGKGDSVRLRARVSLYTGRGEFQLIVQHLEPAGDGALQLAFERLKAQLQAEGLFDPARKRPVPDMARRVGVITSASGAALHDILSVLERRSPMTAVFLYPVPVQGAEAPGAIVAAIAQANELHRSHRIPLDVLIVGRGGGSLEDLQAFNDEQVARAIAGSDLPVVAAVGHEIDFSIADFTADQRAATPSAAAEMVSIDQLEWMQRFDRAAIALRAGIQRRLGRDRDRLQHLRARLRHPGIALGHQRRELASLQGRMRRVMATGLASQRQRLADLKGRLAGQHPARTLTARQSELARSAQRLEASMKQRLGAERTALTQYSRLLHSLGPANTLARGYAVVQGENGGILRRAQDAPVGTALSIRLSEGTLAARVESATQHGDDDVN